MKVKLAIAVWTILVAVIISIGLMKNEKDVDIDRSVLSSYLATCRIDVPDRQGGEGFISTGVLLDTGYILTAAHCIDTNADQIINPNERNPIVTFYGSIASVHTGHVLFIGELNNFDIAVLWLENPPPSNVSLGDAKFGEEVFTIGMTRGGPSNISTGLDSSYAGSRARASVAAWRGNSGGGLWTKNQELTGILSGVGLAMIRENFSIAIPNGDSMVFLRISIPTRSPLANWTEYTDSIEIKRSLNRRNLSFVYEPLKLKSNIPTYTIMFSEIILVLCCAFVFKRHFFS